MEEALRDRLQDSEAVAIITTPELKTRIPKHELPALKHIILVGAKGPLEPGEVSYEEIMSHADEEAEVEWVDREDPLILHYTSGSTGKPKGVLHVHYAMVGHYQTSKWVLDLKDNDVLWCTADPGWITGTSYGIYGPWLMGATVVLRGHSLPSDDGNRRRIATQVQLGQPAPYPQRRRAAQPGGHHLGATHSRHADI